MAFGIDDAISAASNLASTIITRVWPDATEIEKEKINKAMAEMQNEYNLILGQIEINKIEASHDNWLVSGWRPAVGWVCATSLAYAAIIEPVARFIAAVVLSYHGIFPIIDNTITLQVLFGMLGFGGLRSFEKHLDSKRK